MFYECFIRRVPLRWGGGNTGKMKEALLDVVRRLGAPTAGEIAALLHREGGEHHLKKHLGQLVGMGCLRLRGSRYVIHEETGRDLEIERAFNGEKETDERVRADHAHQRKNFHEAWVKG